MPTSEKQTLNSNFEAWPPWIRCTATLTDHSCIARSAHQQHTAQNPSVALLRCSPIEACPASQGLGCCKVARDRLAFYGRGPRLAIWRRPLPRVCPQVSHPLRLTTKAMSGSAAPASDMLRNVLCKQHELAEFGLD